jgi:tRNA A-37 threonylcarbamoyl transferase component Bud32
MPGSRRVSRVTVDGEILWLKDFDQTTPSKWSGIQQAAFLVTRLELLRPVPSPGGMEGGDREIKAIQLFREAGARVPELRWRKGATIAITDIGETVRSIEGKTGQEGIRSGAIAAAAEVSRIHSRGLVHGRPILRNLTWDGESVGFLDFEEAPLSVMSREAAQARDVFLLLASIGRRSSEGLVREAFAAYAASMPPGVAQELQRVTRLAPTFGNRLAKQFVNRLGSRDVTGLSLALCAVAEGQRSAE